MVKMIYIDPPYNTGNDSVYEDDFADSLARYKEVTGQTTKSNPESMGRFHTNWLNMMYPRLRLAANLLRDDGAIFISIDDSEQAIGDTTAYSLGDDCLLLICLAGGITAGLVEQMADYAPAKIILAEHGLPDDTAMSNAHYIPRDRGIELKLV